MSTSTPADHFQKLYAKTSDPWNLSSSAYEVAKYAATLEALPPRRFGQAIEVGCSIGTLTEKLAERCDDLLGVDYVEAPLVGARLRCSHFPSVRFQRMTIPQEWPPGALDLIVLSEVLYFLSVDDLYRLADQCAESLAPSGLILLVNWRGANDGTMPGDVAAITFMEALPAHLRSSNVVLKEKYRIDLVEDPHPI